jgi:uncharacterized protein
MSEQVPVNVGEDITAPSEIASGDRIRIRSSNAAMVARWFGLRRAEPDEQLLPAKIAACGPQVPLPAPGTVLLITGPSGAGKSTLLRELRRRAAHAGSAGDVRTWIDLNESDSGLTDAKDRPVVDCFGDEHASLRDVLLLLSRVGLGEVWSYLRPPAELSEGQRWRFRLALALHRSRATTCVQGCEDADVPQRQLLLQHQPLPLIACDEFAALLDRVTAMVVARCLRRAVDADRSRLSAIVATSHDDLQPALKPDAIAWCDFGRIEYRTLRGE